jgi:argininosuccinate synthase
LDTSVAVAWLREQFDAEVVTLTVDVGGGSLREGRRAAGDVGWSVSGLRGGRPRSLRPRLRLAPPPGERALPGRLPPGDGARPTVDRPAPRRGRRREGADAVAHGCTGKGNDQVRFDVAVHALDPGLEVVAPMRVGMGLTRDQEIDFAIERGIEIPITKASPYSIDVNLWGRSCETGILEDRG